MITTLILNDDDFTYKVEHIIIDNTNPHLYFRIRRDPDVNYDDYEFFEHKAYGKIYYDIFTVYNIAILRRNCIDVNPNFGQYYLNNYFNKILNTIGPNDIMDKFTKLIYTLLNVELYNSTNIDVRNNIITGPLAIVVDNYDKQEIYDRYDYYFDNIIQIINLL